MTSNHVQRPSKKAKLNSSIVDIQNNNLLNISKDANVVSIVNNQTIKSICGYRNLSILSLIDTRIEKISSCGILHILTIIENIGLKTLNIPSVKILQLKDACNLKEINASTASKVSLDNLPLLKNAKLINASAVSISNMRWGSRVEISMPKVLSLELNNVSNIKTQDDILLSNLNRLIIKNCSIVSLSNLDRFDEIIINNCPSLQHIESLQNISNLTITNCPQLVSLDTITNLARLSVSRCDRLRRIKNIEAKGVYIEYCFGLTTLDELAIEYIKLTRCPFLVSVSIHHSLESLIIDHCGFLESLKFNSEHPFCHVKLGIYIIGDNMIEEIRDWYCSTLLIKENQSLEAIKNVYNVEEISIIDCSELNSISGIYVLNSITAQCCPSLELISNVYGFSKLSLIDCESLVDFKITMSKLETVYINGCPELNFQFIGNYLEHLTLIDTGFTLIHKISPYSTINIKNARLLPDIHTVNEVDTTATDREFVYEEAIQLQLHMKKMFESAKFIFNHLKSFQLRCRFINFIRMKKQDRLSDCVICQESIKVNHSILTECNHMFHSVCLTSWFNVRRSCPLCNQEL